MTIQKFVCFNTAKKLALDPNLYWDPAIHFQDPRSGSVGNEFGSKTLVTTGSSYLQKAGFFLVKSE